MEREDVAIAYDEPTSGDRLSGSGEDVEATSAPLFARRRAIVMSRRRLFDRKHLGRSIGAALSLAIFLLAFYVLVRVLANLDMAAVRQAITATNSHQIAAACFLTAVSYLALTGYDALALRHIRAKIPYRVTALGSFTSYAVSFMLGFPLITGGAVRYWIYSRAGLTGGRVASLTLIAGVTFWIGMGFVVGVSLLARSDAISYIDHLSPLVNILIGSAVMLAILVYVAWVSIAPRRVRLQGFRINLPGPMLTLGQVALGVTDLCAAAGVLYVLLPAKTALDFPTFAATYVFACILGIVSHAPGGIGVFEATMIKFVPTPSEEAMIASLLLFRIIYYFIPFVLALALLGASEGLRRWTAISAAMTASKNSDED